MELGKEIKYIWPDVIAADNLKDGAEKIVKAVKDKIMAVLVNENTKVICQGFTGSQGHSTLNRRLHMAQKWLVV